MQTPSIIMDNSTVPRLDVYREERFRPPSPLERKTGLWVDRIGDSVSTDVPRKLRMLGQYAAVLVRVGTGRFISDRAGRIRICAGDVMLQFPDEPCTYFPETQWSTLWVVWNGAEAARLESWGYLNPRRPVVRDRFDAVSQAHAALGNLMGREGLAAVLKRKVIVLNMVHDLHLSAEEREPRVDARMEEALQYLTSRVTDPPAVPELARRFHLSPTHFRRLFRAHTGRGLREFIIARRIALAKEHLSRGSTIKQAAQLCGFDDVFYFMRVFRRVAGITPGRFAVMGK